MVHLVKCCVVANYEPAMEDFDAVQLAFLCSHGRGLCWAAV
jgi:hypothetical protein